MAAIHGLLGRVALTWMKLVNEMVAIFQSGIMFFGLCKQGMNQLHISYVLEGFVNGFNVFLCVR